jgi:hypothetical protein
MITTEQALDLKAHGYPQEGESLALVDNVWVAHPDLEELIEACGEAITLWITANRTEAKQAGTKIVVTSATTLQAVINLYKALNKND